MEVHFAPELQAKIDQLVIETGRPAGGFRLHPLAAQDIRDIWTFIAKDSPQAARRGTNLIAP